MKRFTRTSLFLSAVAVLAGSIAIAQPAKDKAPEMTLPPGYTPEDMQACVIAGTPGKMHEHLAKQVGTWTGETQMWMAPNTPAMKSPCTWIVTSVLDGRYIKAELKTDMPGMGPMTGLGYVGFDNVTQKFVGNWMDSMSTGIMNGTGELSADGKVTRWSYTFSCPITKKPAIMRQVETVTGPNAYTLEMFTPNPKTGVEYKCMQVDFTRKP